MPPTPPESPTKLPDQVNVDVGYAASLNIARKASLRDLGVGQAGKDYRGGADCSKRKTNF
jgi:hypothetical protein